MTLSYHPVAEKAILTGLATLVASHQPDYLADFFLKKFQWLNFTIFHIP